MNTVPVLSWEWTDWIEPAIYQINDAPVVHPVYVGEASNPAWRLMEQLSGGLHSELWHKIAPYSEISAWHQLLQRWTITQVAVVADATERKAQEDQIIETLRPPMNRHHLPRTVPVFGKHRYHWSLPESQRAQSIRSSTPTPRLRSEKIASECSTPTAGRAVHRGFGFRRQAFLLIPFEV